MYIYIYTYLHTYRRYPTIPYIYHDIPTFAQFVWLKLSQNPETLAFAHWLYWVSQGAQAPSDFEAIERPPKK